MQEKKLRGLGAPVPDHEAIQAKRKLEWEDFVTGRSAPSAAGSSKVKDKDKARVKERQRAKVGRWWGHVSLDSCSTQALLLYMFLFFIFPSLLFR